MEPRPIVDASLANGGGPGDPGFTTLLRICDGYRVVSPTGRLGRVERIERSRSGKPTALVVRGDLLQQKRVDVPVAEIEWLAPIFRRVLLRHPSEYSLA